MIESINVKNGKTIVFPRDRFVQIKEEVQRIVPSGFDEEQFSWSIPNGLVGQVSTTDFVINVLPSIEYLKTEDYLHLLIPESIRSSNYLGLYSFDEGDEVSKEVIHCFLSALSNLVSQGIPPNYKKKRSEERALVGNVDLVQSVIRSKMFKMYPIITTKDVLEIDYPAIQIIKRAYRRVTAFYDYLATSKIETSFARVTDLDERRINTREITFSKTEGELEHCYNLAQLILCGSRITAGNEQSCTLLINSNLLLQEYVSRLILRNIDREKVSLNKQLTIAHLEDSEIMAYPDVLIESATKVPLDIKNKSYYGSTKNADLYQLISYCNLVESPAGILVYPTNKRSTGEVIVTKGTHMCRIHRLGINISYVMGGATYESEAEFIEQLLRIAYSA